jgi:glycosyltransferase involved in cell wall biosynthesis
LPYFLRLVYHIWDCFNPITPWFIKRIVRLEHPDAIIGHNLKGMSYMTASRLQVQGPAYVHYLHDIQLLHPSGLVMVGQESVLSSLVSRAYQAWNRRLFRNLRLAVAPSQWILNWHKIRIFPSGTHLYHLPSPIPSVERVDVNNTMPRNRGAFTMVFVGQLEAHKGIFLLLEAFQELIWQGLRPIKLNVVGSGSQEISLRDRYPDKNISFAGRLPREEVLKRMSQADCLVVPSLCYENSPTVIYEAIALNLPVIASAIGGNQELISANWGLLFQAGNKDDLKQKIIQMKDQINTFRCQAQKNQPSQDRYSEDCYAVNLLAIVQGKKQINGRDC